MENQSLKNLIITSLNSGNDKDFINSKISSEYNKIINEIDENSNIQIIVKKKTDSEIEELIDELIQDHKEQTNIRKIESLEQKLIKNLDENSYSELIELKSQINRE